MIETVRYRYWPLFAEQNPIEIAMPIAKPKTKVFMRHP
jgi:hypothetical protein